MRPLARISSATAMPQGAFARLTRRDRTRRPQASDHSQAQHCRRNGEKAITTAAKKATELKLKMCIAISDEAGDIKAFLRMDGAPKLSIDIAQNKAYTFASFQCRRMPDSTSSPLLHGITHTPRLTVFGGGWARRSARSA